MTSGFATAIFRIEGRDSEVRIMARHPLFANFGIEDTGN